MRKIAPYIPPMLFLIVVFGLTWCLFFESNIVEDNEKRIAGILTILGITFGLFQFWISEINNKKRRNFDLKYEVYKEFRLVIESIAETLNSDMIGANTSNVHGLVCRLINLINQFNSSIQVNSDFLFNNLATKDEAISIRDILEKILVRTDKFRKEIDDIQNKNNDITTSISVIEQMNWHNEVRDYLKDLHNTKYAFYEVLRDYF